MTAILSTKDLDKAVKVKKTMKNDAYNEVLKECYAKVKTRNKLGYKSIMYKVPSFLFGYPLYDINDLTNFIIRKLQMGGFTIYITHGSLLISWEKVKKEPQREEKPKRVQFEIKEKHIPLPSTGNVDGKLSKWDIERKIREYRNQF